MTIIIIIRSADDEHSNDGNVNPTLWWETIKLKITEQSIHHAKEQKTKIVNTEEE